MTTLKDILNDLVEDIKLIYDEEGKDDSESYGKRKEALEEAWERICKLLGAD